MQGSEHGLAIEGDRRTGFNSSDALHPRASAKFDKQSTVPNVLVVREHTTPKNVPELTSNPPHDQGAEKDAETGGGDISERRGEVFTRRTLWDWMLVSRLRGERKRRRQVVGNQWKMMSPSVESFAAVIPFAYSKTQTNTSSLPVSRSCAPSLTLRALVSSKDAGIINAKGSRNFQEIREQSGAMIQASEQRFGSMGRALTVQGPVGVVARVGA